MINIDDEFEEWMESLSPERLELLALRLKKAGFEETANEDEAIEIFSEIGKKMFLNDLLESMKNEGVIKAAGVSEDGEIIWGKSVNFPTDEQLD